MQSMCEADGVYVLDTGSTDGTAALLKSLGAHVAQETIQPWRFDTARNRSLDLVPEDGDVCVCTDLDEVFRPGWRAELERVWTPDTGQILYHYTWSFHADGSEGVVFWIEKIHARQGYRWTHPVHEVLKWIGPGTPGVRRYAEAIHLEHHPDPEKSRGQYLPLLELSVQEDPEDDRNLHYLGREYMFYGRWDDCIRTLKRHLSLKQATWRDERAASMRFIAKSYAHKGQRGLARDWFLQAIAEAPHLREAYVDLALLLYEDKQWDGVLYFTGCALSIAERPRTYICEAAAWGSLPYDLRAIAFYHTGRLQAAIEATEKALEFGPDQRLEQNLRCYRKEAGR